MRRARAEHQEPDRREDGSASGLRTGDAAADVGRRERVQRAAASCDRVGQATASETRASPIKVINKHAASYQDRERAVYVGRGSALGNPFKVRPHGPYERGQTLGPYERHLRERIRAKDPAICDALNGIYREARRAQQEGGDVLLMCFCAPKPCHAGVVKRILDEHLGRPSDQPSRPSRSQESRSTRSHLQAHA
jgi:hypothetical protein